MLELELDSIQVVMFMAFLQNWLDSNQEIDGPRRVVGLKHIVDNEFCWAIESVSETKRTIWGLLGRQTGKVYRKDADPIFPSKAGPAYGRIDRQNNYPCFSLEGAEPNSGFDPFF